MGAVSSAGRAGARRAEPNQSTPARSGLRCPCRQWRSEPIANGPVEAERISVTFDLLDGQVAAHLGTGAEVDESPLAVEPEAPTLDVDVATGGFTEFRTGLLLGTAAAPCSATAPVPTAACIPSACPSPTPCGSSVWASGHTTGRSGLAGGILGTLELVAATGGDEEQ